MTDTIQSLRTALSEHYEIQGVLGRGGMASVYLARDLKLPRQVAIKVMDPEFGSPIAVERFQREIDTAARLVHPHILTLHDSGRAGELLYYVMPLVQGESLHDRLKRAGPLHRPDAVRIALQVAAALSHAHAHGVIHRDIKPGNILLAEDAHAWVADFGVARAIESGTRSSTGARPGTPSYMSPEQSIGTTDLDGRSDVYSLGCVLYEMLAGRRLFEGPFEVVITQKLMGPPRRLPGLSRRLNQTIGRVIRRALQKDPNARYSSAEAFAEALTAADRAASATDDWPAFLRWVGTSVQDIGWKRGAASVALATAFTLGAIAIWPDDPPVDADLYVVFDFQNAAEAQVDPGTDQLLHDALARWQGLRLASRLQISEGLATRDTGVLLQRAARSAARRLGAGRYVLGEFYSTQGRPHARAALYDLADPATPVAQSAVSLHDAQAYAPAFQWMAYQLLFPDSPAGVTDSTGYPGTWSVAAHRAFLLGLAARERWELSAADSAFREAVTIDADYAPAQYGASQLAIWLGRPLSEVTNPAARALRQPEQLSALEQRFAQAALHMGRSEFPAACAVYETLARENRFDFGAWFGLGECARRDSLVVMDAKSPSRWSFRSSYHRATQAYREAFLLVRAARNPYRSDGYFRVREALNATGFMRAGYQLGPQHETSFYAIPAWEGDSLAFIPYPAGDIFSGRSWTVPSTIVTALERQQRVFSEIANTWSRAFPGTVDALEAVAVSLEMFGAREALDTLHLARRHVTDPADAIRLAAEEIWFLVKFGIPDGLDDLRRARLLADSLLRLPELRHHPRICASLAALLARYHDFANCARVAPGFAGFPPRIPPGTQSDAAALLAYAAAGGPADSIAALDERLERTVRNVIPPVAVDSVRYLLLGQAAALAFPAHTLRLVQDRVTRGDYMLELVAALRRGDTLGIRRELAAIQTTRRVLQPASLAFDAIFAEASILAAIGDAQAAIDWIEPTLDNLEYKQPWFLEEAVQAASLMRTVELRVDLARRLRDMPQADRWQRALAAVRP